MSDQIKKIVIVGGGTAGWITAGKIAAEHTIVGNSDSVQIYVVESPNVMPIGVGEGTWPSMRETLKELGISEAEFLTECDASFKQASKFVNWGANVSKNNEDIYYHPFSLPSQFHEINLAKHWYKYRDQVSLSNAVCSQTILCEHNLAPKQITTPEYSFANNYGYHFDAGKFVPFLQKHCIDKLGVTQVLGDICGVNSHPNGDIKSVITKEFGDISGDLFIDCSGLHGLLLDKHYKIPFLSQQQFLFNDSALAVQVPYKDPEQDIASATISTAQKNGWIWDIGLQSRRGTGYVYSSAHCSDEEAEETLRKYISPSLGKQEQEKVNIRKLSINPGHREKFWHQNVVAVGMSAGFIEPLEASAIALIEQSAKFIANQLPKNRASMEHIATRFNDKFLNRWQQIIEFLKLHYVLSNRTDSQYWLDNKAINSIPEQLQTKLALWKIQSPYNYDTRFTEELFPSASYQYVYYGMGAKTDISFNRKYELETTKAEYLFQENRKITEQLLKVLPSNRALLNKIKQFGLSKI